jgi:hypothetical protein
MPCPICRRPVVRDLILFANEGIAHQTCVDRHEGLRASEVRKRRVRRLPFSGAREAGPR